MACEIVVPDEILQQMTDLGVGPDLEQEVFRRLAADLEYGHEQTCLRLMAPTPTYAYALALMDTSLAARRHLFTFYLSEVGDEKLHVLQMDHRFTDNWFGDPDDGGPGSPEDV